MNDFRWVCTQDFGLGCFFCTKINIKAIEKINQMVYNIFSKYFNI